MKYGLTALLLMSLLAGPGAAATYHVAAEAEAAADENPGTEEEPLKTIAAGVKRAEAGDTVIVHAGVYRERVKAREKGKPNGPFTLRAAPGERVVVTGADPVTGWREATPDDVGEHPHRDDLFVAEVDWLNERHVKAGRIRLYEGGQRMEVARTPETGWWGITEGFSLSEFSDEVHLTQEDPHAWDGWTVAILEQAGGGVRHLRVQVFDPEAHRITLARDYSRYRKKINEERDRYYMENHLSTLDGPGQFVYEAKPDGSVRLIVWPAKPGEDGRPMVEAPRRSNLFYLRNMTHTVIDGFEVCTSDGHGLGMSGAGSPVELTVQNCYVHENTGYGIEMRKPVSCTIRRNVILRNSLGINIGGATDTVVEENDIGWNHGDGLVAPGGTRNLIIRRNCIHDHYLWGHPDNIQFWNDVQGTVIRDNVMINAGQTMMSAGMKDTRLLNNVWLGSRAISMICGGDGWEIRHNTICATGPMPTNFGGKDFALSSNLFAPLHGTPIYGMPVPETFEADYDLLWAGEDYQGVLVIKEQWKDSASSLEQIREKFGQETHGIVADPKFRHAAKAFTVCDYRRVQECTRETLVLKSGGGGLFEVGDHVEVSFDGVVRTVTRVDGDAIGIEPALERPPITMLSVANWGDETDYAWDLRPAEDSPALGAGEDGTNVGSDLDVQAYVRGDFDGDGERDLPTVPAE